MGVMKIAVLVSGGVDSSVALRLLKDQGHELTAFYLKIWLEDELSYLGECPWQEDLSYVIAVCKQAGVPLEVVNFQKEYWDSVISYVLDEIKAGRTPNPDILCNKRVKFGAFLDYIGNRFDYVASGHYAQLRPKGDLVELVVAPDQIKDQTYFLSHLTQDQLKKVMFPIGHLTKPQVRVLARDYDLPNKDRKDSQGICFLGKIKFSDFIKHHCGVRPGDIVEYETGMTLGAHEGFFYYTIGQRQGLRLAGGPWYVVRKDHEANIVYVSRNYYTEDKQRDSCDISSVNWIMGQAPVRTDLMVKLRHGAQSYACTLQAHEKGYTIKLDGSDQGIASGQFAALYDGDVCLGSGVIS
jgi:tRNA-specific 2-thiouridylase